MTITASALVPRETEAFKDDLWEPPAYFLHNWANGGVLVNTSWRTAVQSSRAVSEQRYGLVNKPYRSVELNLQGWDADQVKQLRALLMRMGKARMPLPLVPDRTRLTGIVDPALFIYSGDFSNRRFFVGGYAIGVQVGDKPILEDFAVRKIVAVSDTQITLAGDLNDTRAQPRVIQTANAHTSSAGTTVTISGITADPTKLIAVFAWGIGTLNPGNPPNTVVWNGENLTKLQDFDVLALPQPNISSWYLVPASSGTKTVTATFPFFQEPRAIAVVVVENIDTSDPVGDGQVQEEEDDGGDPTSLPNIDITTSEPRSLILSSFFTRRTVLVPGTGEFDGMNVPPSPIGAQMLEQAIMETTAFNSSVRHDTLHMVKAPAPAVPGVVTIEPLWLEDSISWVSAQLAFGVRGIKVLAATHIYPAIEAELEFEREAEPIHAKLATFTVKAIETPGVSALDPLVVAGANPPGFPTHTQDGKTHPVLTPPVDWRRVLVGTSRQGERSQVGIGSASDVFGTRPRARFSLPYTRVTRAAGFDMLRFFDSRGGRLHPFWLVSPTIDYDLIAIDPGGNFVKVKAVGAEFDWAFFPFIAFKQISIGTITIRKITSVVRTAGDEDQVFVDVLLPVDLAVADHRATSAHLARFDTDAFPEGWATDELMQFELAALELIDEKDVTVTLDDLCPGGSCVAYTPDLLCDLCRDDRCGTDQPGGCCVCFTEDITLICSVYDAPDETCAVCGCILVSQVTFILPPISCIAGIARWGNGDQEVTLNTNDGTWTYDLGTDLCIGDVLPNPCFCTPQKCDSIRNEDCFGLSILVNCNPGPIGCNYVEGIRIICPSCDDAKPECA